MVFVKIECMRVVRELIIYGFFYDMVSFVCERVLVCNVDGDILFIWDYL